MRVAIITPNLAHYRRSLYKKLDENKSVDIVHWSDDRVLEGIASINPLELRSFRRIKNYRVGRLMWQCGAVRAAFDRSIDKYVFTGNANYISTWIASLIARARRKPVFFWTIGWHRNETGIRRLVRLAFYRIGSRLLVYTEVEMERARAHGYPNDSIDVVYNSVPAVEEVDFDEVRSWTRRRAVGAIARLNPSKSFHLLIEAVSLLGRRGRNISVVLGGDGPEKDRLQRLCAEHNVQCSFLGEIHDKEQIDDFYRVVGLTVVPTAAGLTTIQSLAYGAPVITDDNDQTQMPEASAVTPGRTGSRYAAGNIESLADDIASWMDQLDERPDDVVSECIEEVQARWTPQVQADRILTSLGGQTSVDATVADRL